MTGVLEDIPSLSDEQSDLVKAATNRILKTTEDFRMQVRRRVSPAGIQAFFESEKMCALGLTGGAVAGALL